MPEFKKIDFPFIATWCKANNQMEWLTEELSKTVSCKVYPKVKNAEGKKVADKTKEPKIQQRPITFVQIKQDFVNKFMPEIKPPKKEKAPTMAEILAKILKEG